MGKSDSLKYGINRATLSGPKSKQHRIRQTAHHFVKVLRQANMGARKWTKVTNKHFQRVADAMRADGGGNPPISRGLAYMEPSLKGPWHAWPLGQTRMALDT